MVSWKVHRRKGGSILEFVTMRETFTAIGKVTKPLVTRSLIIRSRICWLFAALLMRTDRGVHTIVCRTRPLWRGGRWCSDQCLSSFLRYFQFHWISTPFPRIERGIFHLISTLISTDAFSRQVNAFEASIPYSPVPLSLPNFRDLKTHPQVSETSIPHILLGTEAPLPQSVVVEVIRPSQRLFIPARTFRRSRTTEIVETSIV
jgi:hypothetical protein